MIWLTWRQFRVQALLAAIALVVVAAVVFVTGAHLHDLYDTSAASCRDCAEGAAAISRPPYSFLRHFLGPFLLAVPLIIGMFWGAPLLARELESGTFRLAWTQSVTRTRWLAVKVAIVGVAAIAVSELMSLLVTWWFAPLNNLEMTWISPAVFDERGIVAIGYAAFAFALGVCAGALLRRTLLAMATTFVVFVAVRLVVAYWLRERLIGAVHMTQSLSGGVKPVGAGNVGFELGPSGVTLVTPGVQVPGAWVYSTQIVNRAGDAPTQQSIRAVVRAACPNVAAPPTGAGVAERTSPAEFESCTMHLSAKFHLLVSYQPADRYWTFQGLETAIFLAAALALIGLSFWWVRRRLV